MQDFKPNSHRFKEEQQKKATALPEKKVEKVIKGKVKTKKKSEISKLSDVFISDDASNVKSYILMDVLVPTIKKAIVDIGTDALNMIFLGGTGRGSSSRGSNAHYVSYSRFSEPRDRFSDSESRRPNTRFDYDNIVFETRADAEAVIEQMFDIIDRYGMVTVADLYDMVEMSHPFTSNDYGWTSLRNADVIRARGGGYVLKLPKALPIDK